MLADICAVTDLPVTEFGTVRLEQAGVGAIPVSALTLDGNDHHRQLLRFAFCKYRSTLEDALNRLLSSGALAS
ncbi:hypothetical protein M3B43_10435 [Nesterenkonia massiliensis]|uniref:Uncharacterized protein n=1 Tax=Nesterenkonia massiliensis TaxID=1232429 RepID=A0ABT2HSM9_9MICC|nr:hypothetical protein [Nesterenkonia massiliensis]MCT1607724.1 hypothetical protein [Nesterenkonia massiliensis]